MGFIWRFALTGPEHFKLRAQVLGKLVFGSIAPVRPRWHPRSAYGFGPTGRPFAAQGTNQTLTPLVPHESRCAGMTPCGGACLRRRRC
jgi:hypothetical protein